MPKTRLISPGSIPNHKLLKNLQLRDNYISNDGGDEGIRIDNDGKVGIGTDDPDGLLHVQTASANSAKEVFANDLIVEGTNATGITISTSNSQDKYLVFGTYNDADVGWIKYDGSDNMTFKVNDTEDVLYLKSDGNVGIGNSAPVSALDVRGSVGTGAGSAGVLTLSTKETTIRVGTNDQLGRIDFQAPSEGGGTDARLVGASIHAVAVEDFAADNNSTALVFSTGTTTAPIERMRIDQDGNVGVNTPTHISPATKLEIFNSNVQYSTGTAYQSGVNMVGSGTTFTAAMEGGRFVFDDGTDAGIITAFGASTVIIVSTSQTVGASDDLRSYKIYYPSVQIDTGASSTSLKIGNMSLGKDGTSTILGTDIALSSDGGNITMDDGTTTIFDFNVDNPSFTIRDAADTLNSFSIIVGDDANTIIRTIDNAVDGSSANLTLTIDGYIKCSGTFLWYTNPLLIDPITLTASGTTDYSLKVEETLNLSSGAGGSDVHHGIWYAQTQTDLTGWDSAYLMYLTGGDAARTFAVQADGRVGIGVAAPESLLDVRGVTFTDATCDTTNTDATVTMDSTTKLAVRMAVQGTGIPTNAYVASITNGTTFELSVAATASNTNETLTFNQAGILTLSTASTEVDRFDHIGRINFQAPNEAAGTDAILVGASIWAEAEESFTSSNNSTALVFATGTTTLPIERMRINQDGDIIFSGSASGTCSLFMANTDGVAEGGYNHTLEITNDTNARIKSLMGNLDLISTGTDVNSQITMTANRGVVIDQNLADASSPIEPDFKIDYDITTGVTSGTLNANGLEIDMNSETVKHAVASHLKGILIDVEADTNSTDNLDIIGIDITVAGGDDNYAILTKGGNVGIGAVTDWNPADPPLSLLEVRGSPTNDATGCTGILTLSTALTDINALDQLGRINFQAPKEASPSDAKLPGAAFWGEAEATFASDNNSTALVFGVNTTAAAAERMRLTSTGVLKLIYDATNYATLTTSSSADLTIATVGSGTTDSDITLDADGSIILDSADGVFEMHGAGTTAKFADMYAGMILGYTRISNNSTTSGHANIEPDATMTVLQTAQGTDVSVTFVAPPSGNVEISMLCNIYTNSRTLEFALSDNASFQEIGETHTYDAGAQSSDETDQNMTYVSFINTGLTPGTSYERWIAAAETLSGTSTIRHGRNRALGTHFPPIIIKAIALPATIVTGE